MVRDENRPIVIKRIEQAARAHHGGAWKVAYADFVTAMMAFFLLLWLLGATSESQRKGIADYFSPNPAVSNSQSGAGGVLGGLTITVPGPMASPGATMPMEEMPAGPETIAKGDPDAEVTGSGLDGEPQDIEESIREAQQKGDMKALAKAQKALDDVRFRDVQEKLERQLASDPDLLEMGSHVRIERTPEGLRIQILDQEKWSMFPSGGAGLSQRTFKLMAAVSKAIAGIPNKVSIRGHTDSKPFPPSSNRDNWILSAERANATRSAMVSSGLDPARVAGVTGLSDIEPIAPDPMAPENRRISVMLMAQPSGNKELSAHKSPYLENREAPVPSHTNPVKAAALNQPAKPVVQSAAPNNEIGASTSPIAMPSYPADYSNPGPLAPSGSSRVVPSSPTSLNVPVRAQERGRISDDPSAEDARGATPAATQEGHHPREATGLTSAVPVNAKPTQPPTPAPPPSRAR
jgi:chemotaxis protein MotB